MLEQTNLIIKKNDSWSRTLYFEDEDAVDLDITGWKVYFMVKEKIDDTDAAAKISKTITTHTAPLSGETTIELSSADTNLLGNYYFAIKVITDNTIGGAAEAITVLEGMMVFEDRVVQATS
jgi:hypothetical protein